MIIAFAVLPAAASAKPVAPGPWVLPAKEVSALTADTNSPRIAFGPDGTAIAVWCLEGESSETVQASIRPPGGTFGPPVDISDPGMSINDPGIAFAPDGSATAFWSRFDDGGYVFQTATRPPGGSFAAPVDISPDGVNAIEPDIAIGADGAAVATWLDYQLSSTVIQAAVRRPDGMFGKADRLSASDADTDSPQVTIGADGITTVVWRQVVADNVTIEAATRAPGESFSVPAAISNEGAPNSPRIVESAVGETTVVWMEQEETTGPEVKATTRPAQGDFGAPVAVSPPTATYVGYPVVAVAPDGTLATSWYQQDGTGNGIQVAIRQPGGGFANPVDVSGEGTSFDLPELAFAADGTLTAVWQGQKLGNGVTQTASRPPGGTFGTPRNLSDPTINADSQAVASATDGTGISTAIWIQYGTTSPVYSASTATPDLQLSVTRPGDGKGSVRSDVSGIDCGSRCSANLPAYTSVTLTATPADDGSTFSGWEGACTGTGSACQVRMDEVKNVTANFKAAPVPPCKSARLAVKKVKPNRRRGTARLTVKVNLPGRVSIKESGKVKPFTRKATKAGQVKLTVRARGKAAKQLKHRGRVKLKVAVLYRPGAACQKQLTGNRKVKLVRRR